MYLCVCKYPFMAAVMSLCKGLCIASWNCASSTDDVEGHVAGFALMKTLQGVVALGTLNRITLPKPSSVRDSTARWYSGSAIERADRFPCLKVTTGPCEVRTMVFTLSRFGCSTVLSQTVLVICLRNSEY